MNLERNGMNGTEEPISTRGLADRLRRVGQRVTPQRLVILGALRPGSISPPTRSSPASSRSCRGSTARRSTARWSCSAIWGLVSMTDLGGGARQFELIDDLHHHLICHRCGAILELDDALVDPLRDGIRDRYGFALAIDHLAVFGFCSVCARVTDSHGDSASSGRR